MTDTWNPWHGCQKFSVGCVNCYVYRRDAQYEKDSTEVTKNKSFYAPIERYKNGGYKMDPEGGVIYTCFTSDFFLEQADEWRDECWQMIKRRSDKLFFIITKRIHRFEKCIPSDWGDGYDNVHICCTCENQKEADNRLPIYLKAPIKHKSIICEPLLEKIDLSAYLTPDISQVVVGGESGNEARVCDYEWVLDLRRQCEQAGVAFAFKQTGARFIKDGRLYRIPRKMQHAQAKKADINIE
ncbi:MAG: DUF5131 family protein [Eubacterium sp.]|nr:DUF5131 family protein [Eubacterium sp.]